MTRLLGAELRRLLARRLLRSLLALTVLGALTVGVIAFFSSDDSPQAIEAAARAHEREVQRCVDGIAEDTPPDSYPPDAVRDPQGFCAENVWSPDPRFRYQDMQWVLGSLGLPLAVLGWLAGATAVGAEWHHRTMALSVLWEPRRIRLLAAKFTAIVIVVFIAALFLQSVFSAALLPAATARGTMDGVDRGWVTGYAALILRIATLTTIAAVLGASLATLGRNTAAALGIGFGYLAFVESLVRRFKPAWVGWLLGDNTALFLIGADEVTHLRHSQAAAGLLLAAYACAAVAVASFVFARREVT